MTTDSSLTNKNRYPLLKQIKLRSLQMMSTEKKKDEIDEKRRMEIEAIVIIITLYPKMYLLIDRI